MSDKLDDLNRKIEELKSLTSSHAEVEQSENVQSDIGSVVYEIHAKDKMDASDKVPSGIVSGLHFYIKDSINQWLFGGEDGMNAGVDITLEDGDSFSVDIIEQPFQYNVSATEDGVRIRIYTRKEIGIFADKPNIDAIVYYDGRKPEVSGTGGIGNNSGEVVMLFIQAACKLREFVAKEHLMDRYQSIDVENEGIMVDREGDDLSFQLVTGEKRPAMACTTLRGDVAMMRPYMNEISKAWELESMPFEQRVDAAENGDVKAMISLANSYMGGDEDVEDNPEKCAYWMKKAAEAGDSGAMYDLGVFYAKGYGVKRNFASSIEWARKALENGEEDARILLNDFGPMAEVQDKAKNGDADAQTILAEGFMKLGPVLTQAGSDADYKESFKWAKKAADQDHGKAIWILALAYEHGRGVPINMKKAIELYTKGAELNDPHCQHNLGCQYMSGVNIKMDRHKGFALIKKSAQQGYGLAMRDLGRCYQFATGTKGNMKTAIKWYEKALKVIDDPELARKMIAFKELEKIDPKFGEDYPEDDS